MVSAIYPTKAVKLAHGIGRCAGSVSLIERSCMDFALTRDYSLSKEDVKLMAFTVH